MAEINRGNSQGVITREKLWEWGNRKLIEYAKRDDAPFDCGPPFEAGFSACLELLFPGLEALERYKYISNETGTSISKYSEAAEVLAKISREIEGNTSERQRGRDCSE